MSRRMFRPLFSATKPLKTPSGINAGEGGARPSHMLTHTDPRAEHKKIIKEARKDPELYILYAVTAGGFALAGWFGGAHLGRVYYTRDRTEKDTTKINGSEPWKEGGEGSKGKYRYHDRLAGRIRDAPSALNSVIVPNVNLPRELHEKYNKWGKDEYDEY
ncbi:hypothetical protein KCU81_g8206, partial [Aureobasidium melanogenum]|uniref:Uncharacterized protein n=1 Tax=Aureobasidium melanogenum (strain CBS 110374) TaxID=1043003 RepID=A0A074VW15_AURM1